MKITTLITTHPARLEQATDLAHTVNGVRITDKNGHGASWCHDKALAEGIRIHGDDDGWLLILEDDAIPCNDWDTQLQAALTACPTNIASLYLGTTYPTYYQHAIQRLLSHDPHWIIHHELRHAVAYAIRADLAPQLHTTLQHIHGVVADKRIGIAAQQLLQPIAYSVPSLCNHKDQTPIITHQPNGQTRTRNGPRVAHRFGTRDEWTDKSITL